MNKFAWFSTVMLLAALVLSGCSKAATLSFSLDADGNYTGFSALPEEDTPETAEKAGYYVREDSSPTANEDLWQTFLSDAEDGKDTGIRIANFYNDGAEVYFADLFHHDGKYRYFDAGAADLSDQPFSYLLRLEGTMPNAEKTGSVTILTDDPQLTYEDIMGVLVSSDSKAAESLSPFRLLFLG